MFTIIPQLKLRIIFDNRIYSAFIKTATREGPMAKLDDLLDRVKSAGAKALAEAGCGDETGKAERAGGGGCAAGEPQLYPQAYFSEQESGERLLLRLFQSGSLAFMPCGLCPPQ